MMMDDEYWWCYGVRVMVMAMCAGYGCWWAMVNVGDGLWWVRLCTMVRMDDTARWWWITMNGDGWCDWRYWWMTVYGDSWWCCTVVDGNDEWWYDLCWIMVMDVDEWWCVVLGDVMNADVEWWLLMMLCYNGWLWMTLNDGGWVRLMAL